MFSSIERLIAFRYLRSKRREGFISVISAFSLIGIALGVATLIVVMSVMNGFRSEFTKKVLGFNGHIYLSSYERNLTNYDSFIDTINSISGVINAYPVIDGQAMARTDSATLGTMVKGIKLSDLSTRKLVSDNIKFGILNNFQGNDKVILGSVLASQLGVITGDKITLISPQTNITAIGTLPRLKSFKVVAIFDTGMHTYDSSYIFMPLEAAQKFFKYPNSVSSIEVISKNPDNAIITAARIDNAFNNIYQVNPWQFIHQGFFDALKVERTVMFLILSLIVFIAAFNIISSLIMLVQDKGKDIAILRTMGATRGMIMRIFLLSGSVIGVVGTGVGYILGISFAKNIETIRKWLESLTGNKIFDPVIYFLSELPSEVRNEDVFWSVFMGLFFSFAATIYPAYKASKQDPAEALRYE